MGLLPPYLANGEISEFFAAVVWNVVLGMTMSVMAQAGFFAYLTLHQVGVNIFRSLTLWNWIQILLIIIVLVDIIVFRFAPGASAAGEWLIYGFLLAVFGRRGYMDCDKENQNDAKAACIDFNIVFYDCYHIFGMDHRIDGETG